MENELDVKDKKILAELEMNARLPFSMLGKKVGLSKQVVKYRVERLEKEKLIEQYYAIVDMAKFGFTPYVIYLKLFKISSKQEQEWIVKIEKHPNVLATGRNAGEWDLTVLIQCKNEFELDKILNEITQGKKEKIQKKIITSEIESTYFNLKLLINKDIKEATTGGTSTVNIDDKDRKIISELAKNCRISLLDLSKKISMSPNGAKERIKQLEKEKIIVGYKTKINYEKLGYLHFRVFLHLNDLNKEIYEKVRIFLKNKGDVESVSRCIGYASIDFRCHVKTIFELYQLISDIKDKFLEKIISVDSMIIFGWEKIVYYK